MNKINKILAVVLVVQVVLLGLRAVWPSSSGGSSSSGGPLVAKFDPSAVNQIQVTNDQGKKITLKLVDNNWVLPDYGDYPVEATRVLMVLNNIKQLKTDRLITESPTSLRALQVSQDQFVRLIELDQADGKSHKLYLGKSGGGNTTHVRLDDQNAVYLVSEISTQDVGAEPTGWIDTQYFSVSPDQVVSLRLQNAQGDFLFTKTGDTWSSTLVGTGETFNQNNFSQLLNYATSLTITAPISKELKDTYGLNAPQATITLEVMEPVASSATPASPSLGGTSGTPVPTATQQMVQKEYSFQIGAALQDGVVVKASNSDYYALISTSTASQFTEKARGDFVTLLPTATPAPTNTPEATQQTPASTPDLTTTPGQPTTESTPVPTAAQPTAEPTPVPTTAQPQPTALPTSSPQPTSAPAQTLTPATQTGSGS